MGKSEEGWHKQGQKDASEGRRSMGGVLDTVLHSIEEITAYETGYESTKGQIDGSKNEYNPPPLDDPGREAYDSAWQAAFDNRE